MARTHTAPWDYVSRDRGIAPYNARCPLCGHECYQDIIPTGVMYTCPKCGVVKMTEPITAEEFDKPTKRVVAVGRVSPGVDVIVADRDFLHTSTVLHGKDLK